jgi:hypothetical protein
MVKDESWIWSRRVQQELPGVGREHRHRARPSTMSRAIVRALPHRKVIGVGIAPPSPRSRSRGPASRARLPFFAASRASISLTDSGEVAARYGSRKASAAQDSTNARSAGPIASLSSRTTRQNDGRSAAHSRSFAGRSVETRAAQAATSSSISATHSSWFRSCARDLGPCGREFQVKC